MIRELYNEICKLTELKPSDKTNRLFSQLVSASLDDTAEHDLSEVEVSNLQHMSAQAEYLMEVHWAKNIAKSTNPHKTLKEFWYFKNYTDLTKLEWSGLQSCCSHNHLKAILFLGSGPLPLTAIILAMSYGCQVTLLDIDKSAMSLSKKVIDALGLSDKFNYIVADAKGFTNYQQYEVIYVAALAGLETSDKEKIVENIKIHAQSSAHIMMRSSYANRALLYKPLAKQIFKKLKPLIEIKPYTDVINSVVIFRNVK